MNVTLDNPNVNVTVYCLAMILTTHTWCLLIIYKYEKVLIPVFSQT